MSENSPRGTTCPLADRPTRHYFGELLGAGVRVSEYDERYVIHLKTATVYGVCSTGSTSPWIPSLLGPHGVNPEVYSTRFAARMKRMFEMGETVPEEATLDEWQKRPLHARLIENALVPIRPLG